MRAPLRLLPAVVVAAGLMAPPPATAGSGPAWDTVRGSQRISEDTLHTPEGCQPDTETEPHIAMDPSDPNVVVAVFQVGRCGGGAAGVGYATSLDGGRTWTAGVMPKLTKVAGGPFDRGDDPAVAFGPEGSVYVVEMGFNVGFPCRSAVAVQRSDDHGITFGRPMYAMDDCQTFNDKTWIAVDTYPSSPYLGRVYVAWTALGPRGCGVVVRRSEDRGATWSRIVKLSSGCLGEGALPIVQPDGDLTVVYLTTLASGFQVARTSHDGGRSFDPRVTIARYHQKTPRDLRTGFGIPSATVDPSTGTMFVVWQDDRFESVPVNDIVISASTDGGATWTAPRPVNPTGQEPVTDHFTPALAAAGGFVHVTYYARRRAPGQFETVRVFETTASESHLDFGPEVSLGMPGDLEFAARSGKRKFLGDYMGLTASASAVHAVWCRPFDEPTQPGPFHQTAWSATVLP